MTDSAPDQHLQLRRLEVTRVHGDTMFADDVILAGRLLLHLPDTVVIVPCSDVTGALTDLVARREVATATLLLRPVEQATARGTVVTLTVLTPVRVGQLHVVGSLQLPAAVFDDQLRQLASAARAYCADRGELMLVDDLTPLAGG